MSAGASPALGAGWAKPFRVTPPVRSDVPAPLAGFNAGGDPAIAYGMLDAVDPAHYSALVTASSQAGHFATPVPLPGSQQILALAPDRAGLELLAGTSPAGVGCCTGAEVEALSASGVPGPRHVVAGNLDGDSSAQLIELPRGELAVIASGNGVWVVRAGPDGRFGPARRLEATGPEPPHADAAALPGGRTAVAFTAPAPGEQSPEASQQIMVALGAPDLTPASPRLAVQLPAGYSVDDVQVAPGRSGVTLAWTESWYDAGDFYSQAYVADLTATGTTTPVAVSSPGTIASAITLTADARGDQALAWQACSAAGVCTADLARRLAGRAWGSAEELGQLDATDAPALAESPAGTALVVWVSHGQVWSTAASPRRIVQATRRIAVAQDAAAGVSVALGPRGQALATWSQGTEQETVDAARYAP